jgi:hypothetical protein
MLVWELAIELKTGSQLGACVECCIRDRDFSEKKVYQCELCGRLFCEKHVRPRTFLLRGLDGIEDEQIPEGIGLADVPIEPSPEQSSLFLGTSVSWIKGSAQGIMDRFRSRKGKRKQWKGQDSHPDFQYTRKWLEQLNIEDVRRHELTRRALNRMKRYYSQEKLQAAKSEQREP